MTALTLAISGALVHFIWQGAIVGFTLWITLIALKQRSAKARYAASCAALALLVLLPVATVFVLHHASAPHETTGPVTDGLRVTAVDFSGLSSRAGVWATDFQRWLLPIWSLGVLIFSLRLIWGCTHAFALGRRGEPAEGSILRMVSELAARMRIRRPVRVLISTIAEVPSVVGWLRPIVLLPAASILGLTPIQLEAVLAHELAHIRRLDYLVNILQMIAETLLFYHPAVWWTSKRIRLERELCCDDLAVQFCGDALCYARALTALEKARMGLPGFAMGSTSGPLLYRIRRIVGVRADEHRPSRLPALVAICLSLACIAVNTKWVRGQAPNVAEHQEPPAPFTIALDSPGINVDLRGSTVIHRSAVQYPETLLKQGLKATVNVEVTIDSAGLVTDARVLSGPQELRKAALQSVLDWHFTHDAANSSRQISITFEPPPPGSQVKKDFFIEAAQVTVQGPVGLVAGDGPHIVYEGWQRDGEAGNAAVVKWFSVKGTQQSLQNDMEELKTKLKDIRTRITPATEIQAGPEPDQGASSAGQIQKWNADIETRVGALRELETANLIQDASIEGRTVQSIGTPGLSDSVRHELLSRLPIREGDTMSPELMKATKQAVHEFDEHLEAAFILPDKGHMELRILVRGAGAHKIFATRGPRLAHQ